MCSDLKRMLQGDGQSVPFLDALCKCLAELHAFHASSRFRVSLVVRSIHSVLSECLTGSTYCEYALTRLCFLSEGIEPLAADSCAMPIGMADGLANAGQDYMGEAAREGCIGSSPKPPCAERSCQSLLPAHHPFSRCQMLQGLHAYGARCRWFESNLYLTVK